MHRIPDPKTQPNRLVVEYIPISSILDNSNNPRKHPRRQIEMLMAGISQFGFAVPILIDEKNVLLAGHARREAAKQLNLPEIPAIRATHLSESQKRGFMLADNRLAERSSWDKKQLRSELQFLNDLDIDFNFAAIGFETAELDFHLEGDREEGGGAEALDLEPSPLAVSKLGELWELGQHRIFCGSALEPSSYTAALMGGMAQCVFTDPPYNVPTQGHAAGRGATKYRPFQMASGEMSDDQFREFLLKSLVLIMASVPEGAICFVCMDWRHMSHLLAAAEDYSLINVCVWVKNNGGMGSLYRSQHELVFVFKKGDARHINNVELGKHGRNRTNVWEYAGSNRFGSDRNKLLSAHPTVKPVAMVADAIKDCSNRGDLILDPFGGSGTTLIAAEKTKRRAALIEIDPLYVDLTIRRWQMLTGRQATLAGMGELFSDREHALLTPSPSQV